jgi:hypothetical protein
VSNHTSQSFDFAIRLIGIKEFHLQLKNNITTLEGLKLRIEFMYAFMHGKALKIDRIKYYESYTDIVGDSKGIDDAEIKYHWKELICDNCVQRMWSSVEGDPAPHRLAARLLE